MLSHGEKLLMDVDLTDQTPLGTGPIRPVTNPVPKLDIEIDVGDLSPLAAEKAADGTRSKLTAAPPPIPARAKGKTTMPPPIPQRSAKGTLAPRPSKPSLVEPKATPEMMASWQINPEAPLASVKAPVGTLPTTIELVRAPVIAEVKPDQATLTGNAPNVMIAESGTALPVVQQEVIPSPRESRVTQLPTSQPGADVADLPMWPQSAAPKPTMGEVLAQRASQSKLPPPRGRTTLPPPIPTNPGMAVATPIVAQDLPSLPPATQLPPRPTGTMSAQIRAPRVPTLGIEAVEPPSQASALDGSDGWVFEDDYEERHVDGEVVPTTYFERSEPLPVRSRPRYLLALGAGAAAIAVIAAIAMHGSSTDSKETTKVAAVDPTVLAPTATPIPTAPVTPEAPTVAAPTTTAATASPTAPAALTTLPITSWPNGATVTLVDNGNATVLGRTPVNAALDPSHTYDVVLAVVGRPTIVKHVDFATMHEIAVDLDPEPPVTAHVAAPAPAPVHVQAPAPVVAAQPEHHHHHHQTTGLAIATPDFATTAPKPKQVAAATPVGATGNGVLMISAKPPCEIVIDGKPTKLMTPQRALAVPAGAHTVTLINAQIGIRKQFGVKVDAKKPTKLIEDFTKG